MSFPSRLLLRLLLNIAFVWLLTRYLGTIFLLTGGLPALLLTGLLLTLLDLFIRPFLALLTLPLRLILSTLTTLVINAAFLAVLLAVLRNIDPAVISLVIAGTARHYLLMTLLFGLRDGLLHLFFR